MIWQIVLNLSRHIIVLVQRSKKLSKLLFSNFNNLKVRRVNFQNVFLVPSILPKNERKQFIVVTSNFFVRFFGRIEDTKKTFRNIQVSLRKPHNKVFEGKFEFGSYGQDIYLHLGH